MENNLNSLHPVIFPNVRARAPLRLGLAGGGTDLASFSDEHGGVVLNATIDRYAFAHLCLGAEPKVVFKAIDMGLEENLPCTTDIEINEGLCLHRAVYRHMMRTYNGGRPLPLTISTTIDVPAGSGLGASSALTVALIEAFAVAMQLPLGPYDIAKLAYQIERVDIGLMGGKQDQYAAAFGGFNFIEFLKDDAGVVVNPLRLRDPFLKEFESSLIICFSGQSRESADIIRQQVGGLSSANDSTVQAMHDLKRHAIEMKSMLLEGKIKGVADVLNESWRAKKLTAASVSNSDIDRLMEVGLQAGAWAGKVSGAGGGGFIMLLSDPERRFAVINALNANGGEASAVKLTFEGVEGWAVPDFESNARGGRLR
jgi:D-glycero-alpha-D-manno-heptose-7-phosphate kinase